MVPPVSNVRWRLHGRIPARAVLTAGQTQSQPPTPTSKPAASACAGALAGGTGPAVAELCLGEEQEKQGRSAPEAGDRERLQRSAVEHYRKAENLRWLPISRSPRSKPSRDSTARARSTTSRNSNRCFDRSSIFVRANSIRCSGWRRHRRTRSASTRPKTRS